MIVTVFRQRTDPDFTAEYGDIGKAVVETAPSELMAELDQSTIDTSDPNYVTIDLPFHSACKTIEVLASIDLRGTALPEGSTPFDGRETRMRRVTLEPGGVIAAHPHDNRPTILYLEAGTLVEYSTDKDFAVEHAAPAIVVPTAAHRWRNAGEQTAVMIGVDLFDPATDSAQVGIV